MQNTKKIRLATIDDSASILRIYTPFITDTIITFEYTVPSITEFKERMAHIQASYPWLVCEINNIIAGYAYASRFREREAYKWSVDFAIYIDPEYQGKNIGKALYYALSEALKLQGYYNAYAGVTIPNVKSEGLHEAFGFHSIGTYHNVGYKFGGWHDVRWYEINLKEHQKSPEIPKSIDAICNTEEFITIIDKAERMIKI